MSLFLFENAQTPPQTTNNTLETPTTSAQENIGASPALVPIEDIVNKVTNKCTCMWFRNYV